MYFVYVELMFVSPVWVLLQICMGSLSLLMVLKGCKVVCVCMGIPPGLLGCSVVGVGPAVLRAVIVKQCYSMLLVGVLMVLKECRLLSACVGISTVPLLLMVLKECKILGVCIVRVWICCVEVPCKAKTLEDLSADFLCHIVDQCCCGL